MGGAIAARWAMTRDATDVCGLALSAPATGVGRGVFPILRRLAAWVSRIFPRMRIVGMGGTYVSRDPEVVRQFAEDPLVFHGRFPVRTGAEILANAQWLQDHAAELTLPLLILQGTDDRVVDPASVRRFAARAGAGDKTLHVYEGFYHELLSEPEREAVRDDLLKWLAARATSRSAQE